MNGEFKSLVSIYLSLFSASWDQKNWKDGKKMNEIRFIPSILFYAPYTLVHECLGDDVFSLHMTPFYLHIEVQRSRNVERTILNGEILLWDFFGRHFEFIFGYLSKHAHAHPTLHHTTLHENMTGIFGPTSSGWSTRVINKTKLYGICVCSIY